MDFPAVLSDIPGSSYAVGVSGGADSTALLLLLREHRPDLSLHVVHLNHETRGEASDGDAAFVAELAQRLGLPATIARRREIDPLIGEAPSNPSALYRALRLWLFADVCRREALAGALLAHHALDQAETVLHRLLRGSGAMGLAGMSARSRLQVGSNRELVVRRPLLEVMPEALRGYLETRGQGWREDASNRSEQYFRNRLRRRLEGRREVVGALLDVSRSCAGLRDWVRAEAPAPGDGLDVATMAEMPQLLAAEAARHFLSAAGAPADDLTPAVLARLVTMAQDAASPPRQHFPGKILIRRRRGKLST